MIICLCATRNMYPQLQAMIVMLVKTQPKLKKIYAFIEDDLEQIEENKVTFINVSKYAPVVDNPANNGKWWSYMSMIRCYFTDLLPNEDKVIYLDLDVIIEKDISELWDIDMTNHEIAGVIDSHVGDFNYAYIKHPEKYINSGSIVMNLKLMRENGTDKKIDDLLHTWELKMADQDALNLMCSILYLDCKWNSSDATTLSHEPVINHVIRTKPWDPNSKWFPQWAMNYLKTGAKQSINQF